MMVFGMMSMCDLGVVLVVWGFGVEGELVIRISRFFLFLMFFISLGVSRLCFSIRFAAIGTESPCDIAHQATISNFIQ